MPCVKHQGRGLPVRRNNMQYTNNWWWQQEDKEAMRSQTFTFALNECTGICLSKINSCACVIKFLMQLVYLHVFFLPRQKSMTHLQAGPSAGVQDISVRTQVVIRVLMCHLRPCWGFEFPWRSWEAESWLGLVLSLRFQIWGTSPSTQASSHITDGPAPQGRAHTRTHTLIPVYGSFYYDGTTWDHCDNLLLRICEVLHLWWVKNIW